MSIINVVSMLYLQAFLHILTAEVGWISLASIYITFSFGGSQLIIGHEPMSTVDLLGPGTNTVVRHNTQRSLVVTVQVAWNI